MSMKEKYQEKLEAQLDEWKAEIGKLKAKCCRSLYLKNHRYVLV